MTAKEARELAEKNRIANERARLDKAMESVGLSIDAAIRGGITYTFVWIATYAIEFVTTKLRADGYRVTRGDEETHDQVGFHLGWGEDV
jgi:hypothetical protein